ncbi:MAG TPA: hypothetical protein VFL17_21655 [Anaerolineae bacterium]|nr:hypothetical protein [Anaerolineae bacterium]
MLTALATLLNILLVSDQTGEPPDEAGPEIVGARYEKPDSPPAITMDQAIQIAKDRLGPALAAQATQIEANHVLFSDDQYYSTDEQGQRRFFFQKVPAWVVTFRGVAFLATGGRGTGEVAYNTEVHIAINAETGEYMELFTYR